MMEKKLRSEWKFWRIFKKSLSQSNRFDAIDVRLGGTMFALVKHRLTGAIIAAEQWRKCPTLPKLAPRTRIVDSSAPNHLICPHLMPSIVRDVILRRVYVCHCVHTLVHTQLYSWHVMRPRMLWSLLIAQTYACMHIICWRGRDALVFCRNGQTCFCLWSTTSHLSTLTIAILSNKHCVCVMSLEWCLLTCGVCVFTAVRF